VEEYAPQLLAATAAAAAAQHAAASHTTLAAPAPSTTSPTLADLRALNDELEERLRVLHAEYVRSRRQAAADSQRAVASVRQLHALTQRLAQATSLRSFDLLAQGELCGGSSGGGSGGGGFSSGGGGGGSEEKEEDAWMQPERYFYDLTTLDADSAADIRHSHTSCVGGSMAEVDPTNGWWRTQLGELEEDALTRRAAAARQAALQADDANARDVLDGLMLARLGSGGGGGGGRGGDSVGVVGEAGANGGDGVGGNAQATRDSMLARIQGRAYLSASLGRDVYLPRGQRMLWPGERVVVDGHANAEDADTPSKQQVAQRSGGGGGVGGRVGSTTTVLDDGDPTSLDAALADEGDAGAVGGTGAGGVRKPARKWMSVQHHSNSSSTVGASRRVGTSGSGSGGGGGGGDDDDPFGSYA
jgi:hypothetical protein